MTASVGFVSLILVVLNAGQPNLLWRTQTENDDGDRTNMGAAARFRRETQTSNFSPVLTMPAVTSILSISLIYASQ